MTLTSPPEQHDRKTEGPKLTDWTAFIYRPPDTPTVTLTCHQHTSPLILPGTKWPKPGFYPNG